MTGVKWIFQWYRRKSRTGRKLRLLIKRERPFRDPRK